MVDMSDLDLLNALGVDTQPKKQVARSPREERIIAGFEEIQRFVDQHKHPPEHGEDKDIFERIYAVRLDQIRKQTECRNLVQDLDYQGLLADSPTLSETDVDTLDDDALLSELGVLAPQQGDVTYLQHVKPRAEIKAAEEVANRTPCKDFETFKPLFATIQSNLESRECQTRPFKDRADVKQGDWFILSGQKVYVAEMGEEFVADYGRKDCRLRVIYDNGTESDILMRSLQRALNKDPAGRRIIATSHGSLFDSIFTEEDHASGTIYVLRSLSEHPLISQNREIIHKIGVTSGSVDKRIANTKLDPTFLMADVEIVATYELYNIHRAKLEHLIHRFFAEVRLDIQIKDRFGNPVIPHEWFLVPFAAIDETIKRIKDGNIGDYVYDKFNASLKPMS